MADGMTNRNQKKISKKNSNSKSTKIIKNILWLSSTILDSFHQCNNRCDLRYAYINLCEMTENLSTYLIDLVLVYCRSSKWPLQLNYFSSFKNVTKSLAFIHLNQIKSNIQSHRRKQFFWFVPHNPYLQRPHFYYSKQHRCWTLDLLFTYWLLTSMALSSI